MSLPRREQIVRSVGKPDASNAVATGARSSTSGQLAVTPP
jgi:hypothetical protein